MNRFRNLLTVFAFSLLILGLPTFASAQWGNRDRDDDDDYYGRNNDNRNNDNYGRNRNYNRGALRSAIKRLKNRSHEFEHRLDRELDRSRYDDRNREDRLNQLAGQFKDAADRLEDEFGNGRDMNRSADEARQVLSLGEQLDRALRRSRLNYNVQNDWNMIRQDLNTIANAYGYNYNNRNNRNNRNQRTNDDWRNKIPFPLPF